jgi:hypothetical protein
MSGSVGESHTPAVVGAVDVGAYGRRSLVGGVDVAALTCLSRHTQGETLDPIFCIELGGATRLLGVAFPSWGHHWRCIRSEGPMACERIVCRT